MWVLDSSGDLVRHERPNGKYTPARDDDGELMFASDGGLVYLHSGSTSVVVSSRGEERIVPSGRNGAMTRARARVQLREAGIHPYPQDVENLLKTRRLTPGERARHEKKIADKVRRQMGMDDRVRRDVERG